MTRFLILAAAVVLIPCIQPAFAVSHKKHDSDITFVKIRPLVTKDEHGGPHGKYRSSRIQHLPLQIKPLTEKDSENQILKELTDETPSKPEGRKPRAALPNGPKSVGDPAQPVVLLVPKLPKTLPTTPPENFESDEEDEEDEEEDIIPTKRPSRPAPKPHFTRSRRKRPRKLTNLYNDEQRHNFIGSHQNPRLRTYRSRCQCEKLTNCHNIQISIPRCPSDEFYCCG